MNIDVNCDIGEGAGNDADLMPFISSANIACGYHAGDDRIMKKTIERCQKYNVAIGAHPGFNDKPNFGRTPMNLNEAELYKLMWEQLEIIQKHCQENNAQLHHVKPHSALYNMAANSKAISHTLASAVKDFNPRLIFYGLSGSCMIDQAKKIGLLTASEVFADRTYQADGTLTPRSHNRALIESPELAVRQVIGMIEKKSVAAIDGSPVAIHADTICIHGDGKHAVLIAEALKKGLLERAIQIRPLMQP